MHRRAVDSRAVTAVGYEPATNVLEIEFTGGDTYRYFAVPASVHAAFMSAESMGTFFARSIRNTYAYERI